MGQLGSLNFANLVTCGHSFPKFDKTESFLSSPKWVEEMCKEGKFEKAYSRAQKLGMDGNSYSNVWKAVEYFGVFAIDK